MEIDKPIKIELNGIKRQIRQHKALISSNELMNGKRDEK
jgi:hypothetical protein